MIQEVIVSAQKRDERLIDVPMAVTAISGEQLSRQQSYRLEDFVGKVPGLFMSETTGAQLVVRGIASTAASINAPVATYIDDTPLVGVGAFSGGSINTPNLDTFDLARIEVLKGPQGTLYGANALGGLLKYVTNAPDPTGFAAKVQLGTSTVADSDGTGHNARGMVNVPLADNLALRVVGYHNEYPGFIDDPSRGREDMNDIRIYGGRAALLWNATEDLSVRLNVLDQQRRWGGMGTMDVVPGTLAPLHCDLCLVRDVDQPGESRLRQYNATVNWDLGPVELISSTTRYKFGFVQDQQLPGLGVLIDPSGLFGFFADFDYEGTDTVHETRLASKLDGNWDWQTGIYYSSKKNTQNQTYLIVDRLNHVLLSPERGGSFQPTSYREGAAFVNIGYQFTPTFDVSVGGRISEQTQEFEQIGRGGSPTFPLATMNDTVFTYSTDARWRFTPQSMVYARVASGFTPGGPNVAPFNVPVPPTYSSSTTTNYELGYKSSLLDNRLTIELAVFQIDWKDIQLYTTFGTYTAATNGGTAESQGVEWSFTTKPVSGLTLSLTGAFTDAKLTEDTPPSPGGLSGDQLPVTPRWQASAGADYRWPMFGNSAGFAGIDWRYSDRRFADFGNPAGRQELPSYDIVDLRAGIETQRWTLAFYAKNVADTHVISYVSPELLLALQQQRTNIGTPRTLGVDLTVSF